MTTRTNIVLDDELVAQAMVRAGVRTKKAAVEAALKAFVRKPNYHGLLGLEGSRLIADDYDPDAGAGLASGPAFTVNERTAPHRVQLQPGALKAKPAAR